MNNFSRLELLVLYDMLATNSSNYTHMLNHGAAEDEFNRCKQTILDIQAEIDARSKSRGRSNEKDINLIEEHYR